MDWCLSAKIFVTLIGLAGFGYLGNLFGGIIGAIIGAFGGAALVFFWLSTYILFFC